MNQQRRLAAGGFVLLAAAIAAPGAALRVGAAEGRTETRVFKKTPQGELAIHLHFPPDWKADQRRPAAVT